MKRSVNMKDVRTIESRECYLVCENTRKSYMAITETLYKKVEKGIYDHDKAVDLAYMIINAVTVPQYERDFGYRFTVKERFAAACEFVEAFELDM